MATYNFSMEITVDNEMVVYAMALEHAMKKDGMSKDAAEELLQPGGEIDVPACLQMLVDPGYLPGCSIEGSEVN
jgi:hypothetical protein